MDPIQNQTVQNMQYIPGIVTPQTQPLPAYYPPAVSVNVYTSPYNIPAAPIYNYPANNIYTPQASTLASQAVSAVSVQSAPVPPPSSVIDTQANSMPVQSKPEPTPPQAAADIQAINAGLNSEKTDDQIKAISQIGAILQSDPKQAQDLLTEQTFLGLTNVMSQDTGKLPPEEKGKADEAVKLATMATSALQKNLKDIFDADAQKIKGPLTSFVVLPGIRPIIDNIKSHPSPEVRMTSMAALANVADPKNPEEKNELTTIFTLAKKDSDPKVSQLADTVLNSLAQI